MEKRNLFVNDLLKDKKVTKEQVESASKLLGTDVGLLTAPNARYLYEVGVIDRKGHILHRPISKSAFNRPVHVLSYQARYNRNAWSIRPKRHSEHYERGGGRG